MRMRTKCMHATHAATVALAQVKTLEAMREAVNTFTANAPGWGCAMTELCEDGGCFS